MPPHYFPPIRRAPANGVSPRPVPGPLAPERCVQYVHGVGEGATVVLLGVDLKGKVRVKVELASDDVSTWWLKVIRHWLAWCYGASEIKIVG
jgi:hypothetical protein